MKLRYENTFEDLIAFTLYHYDHSPSARRVLAGLVAVVVVVMLTLIVIAALALEDPIVLAIGVCVTLPTVLLVPRIHRRAIEKQARKMYREGANKSMIGMHELELSGNELLAKGPFSESKMRLELVERIEFNKDYTFIYVSSVGAYVIPHDAVDEGNVEAFVEALEERLAQIRT